MPQKHSTVTWTTPSPGTARLATLLGGWTDSAHGTLPQRLAYGLRCAIASGLLGDGTRLPPERSLARELAVSRATVTTALDLLRDDGLVSSRQGSGTVVHGTPQRSVGGSRIAGHFGVAAGIDLAVGNPSDPSHLPPISIDVAELTCARIGPGIQPLGLSALREALADLHTEHGLITDPGQIHVTSGAHQAIALLFGAVAGLGDTVAVEEPNYSGIFDILDGVGARAVSLDADEDGVRPAALDKILREERPAAVYLRLGSDLGASAPSQLLALQLVPRLDELAEHRRQTLSVSVRGGLERLRADLPSWEVIEPRGGSVLWARLPVDDSGPFVALARRHGVHVAPGLDRPRRPRPIPAHPDLRGPPRLPRRRGPAPARAGLGRIRGPAPRPANPELSSPRHPVSRQAGGRASRYGEESGSRKVSSRTPIGTARVDESSRRQPSEGSSWVADQR